MDRQDWLDANKWWFIWLNLDKPVNFDLDLEEIKYSHNPSCYRGEEKSGIRILAPDDISCEGDGYLGDF